MTLHAMLIGPAMACIAVGGLTGCKPAPVPAAPANASEPGPAISVSAIVIAEPAASSVGIISCAEEIGATTAGRRVDVCRAVSPATHPPCNIANSCAMIEDEIARSCALIDSDGGSISQCIPSPESAQAAAAVVTRYYAAINARDYAIAWQQWGDNGPPNQSLSKFTAGFAHTRATHVTIGALEPSEGGAGSIYQTVPVVVDATLDNGTRQRFTGDYVVRRVNGVDGASPAQLRWHISDAHLAKAPAG